MLIYGVYSVLTEESQRELEAFFQHCPVEIKHPLLYELGTSLKADIELAPTSVVYEVVPLELRVRYNPRTGHSALFWDLNSLSESTAARQQELGTVLIHGEDYENSSPYNPIVLSHGVHTVQRKLRAYFNSKENLLAFEIEQGRPMVLSFEGETVIEFEAPDLSVARTR